MPIFQYRCDNCNIEFDALIYFDDGKKKRCPYCNKKAKRLINTGIGIRFKGKGFYCND